MSFDITLRCHTNTMSCVERLEICTKIYEYKIMYLMYKKGFYVNEY